MTDQQTVKISEAKGRPMLQWVGKRPLDYVTAFPAQEIERFDPAGTLQLAADAPTSPSEKGIGLLFHGDNKDVLAWLLAHGYRGKVNLIYIDPPFDSGAVGLQGVVLRQQLERIAVAGVLGVGVLDVQVVVARFDGLDRHPPGPRPSWTLSLIHI